MKPHASKMKRTFPRISICILAYLLCVFNVTHALGCSLPECSISDELKLLSDKNQAFRFQYISKLRANYAKEKDEKILKPLVHLAREIVDLITRLNDEDYILREAKGLRDQTIFLLMQWVWRDCESLGKGYSELTSEAQRFAILDFFLRRSSEIRDDKLIRSIVCFATKAETFSRQAGDADYVSRQSIALSSALSTQLLEVFNGWEGVFRIVYMDGPLGQEVDDLKLVLFSTGGELGIVASLTHPTLRPTIFQNLSFSGAPQFLQSRQSFASQVPSTIELLFDENFRVVKGTFLEPSALSKLHFSAVREIGINSLSQSPCTEKEVIGKYEMLNFGFGGIFSVQSIGPNQYAAVFSSFGGEFRLHFSFGRYNSNTGRLTFINNQTSVPLGWRLLAERDKDGRCRLHGWGLSSFNGASYPLATKSNMGAVL